LTPRLGVVEADLIAAEVGDLPLALQLAGSFLQRNRQIDPIVYVRQLQGKELLQHPSLQGHGIHHSPTGHELSVARTYILSWEQLNPADEVDNMAQQLLTCAACMAPGEPIPVA